MRHLFENAEYSEVPLELMYRMAERLPYIGVYQDSTSTQETTIDPEKLPVAGDEEIPVAWVCLTPLGESGKMMTDERFRRHGFATLLHTTFARLQTALLGFIPHGFVETDNYAPQAVLNKLPSFTTHECTWMKRINTSE